MNDCQVAIFCLLIGEGEGVVAAPIHLHLTHWSGGIKWNIAAIRFSTFKLFTALCLKGPLLCNNTVVHWNEGLSHEGI